MHCNNCLKNYDDRLDVCPYCGNKSKSKGLDVKPVIKKNMRDKPPSRKRIKEFFKRSIGGLSPVIIAGLLVLTLTSAVTAIPRQPQKEQLQEVDLSDKIQQATAIAQTFSAQLSYKFSFIDSGNKLQSIRISDSEVSYYPSAEEYSDLSMIQCSAIGPSIGVKNDGSVQVLEEKESFDYPEFAAEVEKWDDIKQIAVYYKHIIGLKNDGTLVTAGTYDDSENGFNPLNVNEWKNIKSITTGVVSIGLKEDGTLVSTNDNNTLQEYNNIAALPQGSFPSYNIFLQKNGTLTPVRIKGWEEANEWNNIVQFCTAEGHMVGLKEDGTVVAVGSNDYGECEVSEWNNIVAIQASSGCTFGKKADGTFVIATNDKALERSFNTIVNGESLTATADESAAPSAAGDLMAEIETASQEEKTFAIGENSFAFIDSRGQVHRFEITDAAVSELPVDIADNQNFVSLEFSPRGNGAGFGIKKDGSVTVLSNGASGVYNYEAALGFLTNIQDIVSFEDEVTLSNGKQDMQAEIIGLRKDGTIADVVLRQKDDTAVLHPTYDKWKNIKSITVNYLVAVGLNKDGTISEIGTPEEFKDCTNIAAVPQGDIYSGGKVLLTSDGTLLQKSDTSADFDDVFSGQTKIVAFCDNGHYTIGIKKDGTAVASKSRDENRVPDLSDWKNIVAVQANDSFAVGKTVDGSFVMATSDTMLKSNFEEVVNRYTK